MTLEYIYDRRTVVAVAYQDGVEVARSRKQPSRSAAASDVARVWKAKGRAKK